MAVLKSDQKVYLIYIANSAERVAAIEGRIKKTRRRFYTLVCLYLASAGAIGGLFAAIATAISATATGNVLLLIAAEVVAFSFGFIVVRSTPEYSTFTALVSCISKVDHAMGSLPAARSRKSLARRLLRSVHGMRRYGPILPVAPHRRIMSQQAVRGSQALKEFTYTIMLGNDEELARVKVKLGQAAIHVGTTNWVKVGDLGDSVISKTDKARLTFGTLFPLLPGVVVPLLAALIAALVK